MRVERKRAARTAMQVGNPASLLMPSDDMIWDTFRSGLGSMIRWLLSFLLCLGVVSSCRRKRMEP